MQALGKRANRSDHRVPEEQFAPGLRTGKQFSARQISPTKLPQWGHLSAKTSSLYPTAGARGVTATRGEILNETQREIDGNYSY